MNLSTFLIGFGCGAAAVFIPFFIAYIHTQKSNNSSLELMKSYFESTANKVFQNNSSQFSNQAGEKLDEFFKRFRDQLEIYEKRNEANFRQESENFTKFDLNIKQFIEAGSKISKDTNSLVSVMKSDNRTQGKWGEIVLEKVLESSGLRKGDEYKLQENITEGRPDATVYLPEGRCVFIDAKTSISSWDNYLNAESEFEKEEFKKEFITSTKAHISGLAKRDYSTEESSPDYVLMFIPIESCYSVMFCDNCDLWDLAWKNKIMPVSPSTLLAALKIINAFHVVDRQNKNALEISRLCTAMIDKFANLLADIKKVRSGLDSSLVKLQGKGSILSQLEKIQDLGISINKEIPELPDDINV